MAVSNPYPSTELFRAILILLLSFILLPLSTAIVAYHGIKSRLRETFRSRTPAFRQKFLLTDASSPEGLAIARILKSAGHQVVVANGADEKFALGVRLSRAVNKHYNLRSLFTSAWSIRNGVERIRYAIARIRGQGLSFALNHKQKNGNGKQRLAGIVRKEAPDLLIPCGSVRSDFTISPYVRHAGTLEQCQLFYPKEALPEAHTLDQILSNMDTSIRAPLNRRVTTRAQIHKILAGSAGTGKRYILEREGELDQSVILPRATLNQTYQTIADIRVSPSQPWSLREVIHGKLYTAHCLAVDGALKAFVAGTNPKKTLYDSTKEPRPSQSDHTLRLLRPEDPLHGSMLSFCKGFASAIGSDLSGHLSVWFCASEVAEKDGSRTTVHALDYCISPHATLAVLSDKNAVADVYVKAASNPSIGVKSADAVAMVNGFNHEDDVITQTSDVTGTYSLPATVVDEVLIPLVHLTLLRGSTAQVLQGLSTLIERLTFWQEQTWDKRDPWPSWIYWHIEYPWYALQSALSGARGGKRLFG